MARNLPTHRRGSPTDNRRDFADRTVSSNAPRNLLSLAELQHQLRTSAGWGNNSALGDDYPKYRRGVLAQRTTNVAKRFAGLPALPAFRLLAVGETWASHSSHTFHLL